MTRENACPFVRAVWIAAIIFFAYEPTMPAATAEATTRGADFFIFKQIPAPIPAPMAICAILPSPSKISPNQLGAALSIRLPICQMIVPAIKVANKPSAMPLMPSIKM